MSFNQNRLEKLREDVPAYYTKVTGKTFYISGDRGNGSYTALAAHIKSLLNKPAKDIPGDMTFIRFFHKKINIRPNTLLLFEEYVIACKRLSITGKIETNDIEIGYNGTQIIDDKSPSEDLERIRSRLKGAFEKCYGYPILTSGYDTYEHYNQLIYLLRAAKVIGKEEGIPNDNWFIELFSKDALDNNPNMLAAVNSALDVYENKPFKIVKDEIIYFQKESALSDLKGARVIDDDFRSEKETAAEHLNNVKFYTTKIDKDIQWLGVVKGLAFERPLLKIIKVEIEHGFLRDSRVIAGVIGPSGAGKSTFLRELALSCIEYADAFETLWIEKFSDFNEKYLPQIAHKNRNYLVIIEDWTKVTNNKSVLDDFFDTIVSCKNIRLIIGDISDNSIWTNYVYGKNVFKIKPKENELIILHALSNVEEWEDVAKKVLLNKDLYKAPLFLILFVIAKSSEDDGNLLNIDTEDFKSQFQTIVEKDIKKIYEAFPQLSKALYYWASAAKISEDQRLFLSWKGLLKWSERYKKVTDDSIEDLTVFNDEHPFCKVLTHYISFDKVIDPYSNHEYFISFLHDSFVDVFCISPNENWCFLDESLLKIVRIFISIGMKDLGIGFFLAYQERTFQDAGWYGEKPFIHVTKVKEVSMFYEKHRDLIGTFEENFTTVGEQVITNSLYRLFINSPHRNHPAALLEILRQTNVPDGYKKARQITSKLIEEGCENPIVHSMFEACLSQNDFVAFKKNFNYHLTNFNKNDIKN